MKQLLTVVALLCFTISTTYSQVCTGPLTVTVEGSTAGNPLNIQGVETHPLCNEVSGTLSGSIDLTILGGSPSASAPFFSYIWSNGEITEDIFGLGAGGYSVTVTDDKGCTATSAFVLVEPDPVAVVGTQGDLVCNDASGTPSGTIDITASGGTEGGVYDYNWATIDGNNLVVTDEDQSGLTAGTYSVTVTDDNGCTATAEFTLNEPNPVVVVGTGGDLACNDASGTPNGSIDLDASGGTEAGVYDYLWSTIDGANLVTTDEDQSGLTAGTYTVTVTDDNGCTGTAEFTLTEPNPVVVTGVPVDLACNSASGGPTGSIDLTVTGGTEAGAYDYNWSTVDGSNHVVTDEDQTGLTVGTYSVTVTDDNGCTATAEFTLMGPEAVVINGTTVDLECNSASGAPTGEIDLTVTGGVEAGAYDYFWSTLDGVNLVATAEDQTGLGAGTYTVTVTDDNGCTATAEFILAGPDAIVVVGAPTELECNSASGTPTGALDITASGGTEAGAYDYVWTTIDGANLVITDEDQSGLTAGTYHVEVTDDNGCTGTAEFTLTEPAPVGISASTVHLVCNAANGPPTGEIDVTPYGGQGLTDSDFFYSWATINGSGLVTTAGDQTGLGAGDYSVTVTDANGCTAEGLYTLTEPTSINLLASATDLECNSTSGAPDGEIDLSVSGGSPNTSGAPYVFNWETIDGTNIVATAEDQSGLTAGTYDVTVTDGNGCTEVATYTLTEPDAVEVSGVVLPLLCNASSGAPTGEIDVTAIGGQGSAEGDYTYTWDTPDGLNLVLGAADQTGLSSGTYNLTVTDSNGCTAFDTWTLAEPDAIVCSLDSPIVGTGGTNILCAGETGTIVVTATGGTAPFTYSLDGGVTTQTISTFDVIAGSYTVTIIDDNGCESVCNISLTEPPVLVAGTCVVSDECQLDLGEIEVSAEGGVGPYLVSWTSSSGGTLDQIDQTILTSGGSVTFTGAQGGETYTFTVTDANGCEL